LSKIVSEIEEGLKAEGFVPGSAEYENLLLERKVLKCQEYRSVVSCRECHVIDHCTLYRDWLFNIRLPKDSKNT